MRKYYGVTRRDFLKGVAVGSTLLLGSSFLGCAEEKPTPTPEKKPEETPKPEGKPIRIGGQYEMTGLLATYGLWYDRATKAAIDIVNQMGGIADRPVEYVGPEDTQTKADVGAEKMKKLILEQNADFVLGSVHSGVCIASAPLAEQFNTLYFPTGMSHAITASKGNRYMFRLITEVRLQVEAAGDWVLENIGKKWSIVYLDYAWGQSHRDWFSKKVEEYGGKVVADVPIPLGSKDLVPYVSKIADESDAVYYATLGSTTIGFLNTYRELGKEAELFSVICANDGIDTEGIKDIIEGQWMLEYLPRRLEGLDTPYHRAFREACGVDPEGRDVNDPKNVVVGSHYWAHFETVFLLKEAIEKSGWESKDDNMELIQTIEDMRGEESKSYPQGPFYMRAQDHQAFVRTWMSRVENGKLKVKWEIPMEDSMYPAEIDYTKM
jgi:branched-chain amino acid transport system substrate-binding protein